MLFLAGCTVPSIEERNQYYRESYPIRYNMIEIEDCEYIEVYEASGGIDSRIYSLTHKGNCKNPIHEKKEK